MEKELLSVLSDVQIILMTPQDIVNACLLNFVVQKYLTREAQSWDIWVYPSDYVLSDFGTDCDKFPTIPITLGRAAKKQKRPFFIVSYYEGVRTPHPPPFIVTWDSEIFGPYFHVVVDAVGPETDF